MQEPEEIRVRYAKRTAQKHHDLYSPLLAHVHLGMQEKERSIIQLINAFGLQPVENKRVLEIGCGSGSNLLDLIRIGFHPKNLVGNELLEGIANRLVIDYDFIYDNPSNPDVRGVPLRRVHQFLRTHILCWIQKSS